MMSQKPYIALAVAAVVMGALFLVDWLSGWRLTGGGRP